MITNLLKPIFRNCPPAWLFESSGEVRNDLAIHRVERMRSVFRNSCGNWPNSAQAATPASQYLDGLFSEYDRWKAREAVLRRSRGLFKHVFSERNILLGSAKHRRDKSRYRQICRRIHHLAHEIQMTLVTVLPLGDLETSMEGLLEDLESVTEPSSLKRLTDSPVASYVTTILRANVGTLGPASAGQPPPQSLPLNYESYLRSFARQIVNATRRDQITRRQIEVIRDELFSVITFVLVAMTTLATAGFALLSWLTDHKKWWFADLKKDDSQITYIAALGGICGACFSAATRVGNISQSGVTGRNLGQLAGAGRPLFHTSLFGCLAAVVLCLLVYKGGMSQLGPFHFNIAKTSTPDGINREMIPLLIGLIAGFSERLIPDVIDQFRKKKE